LAGEITRAANPGIGIAWLVESLQNFWLLLKKENLHDGMRRAKGLCRIPSLH